MIMNDGDQRKLEEHKEQWIKLRRTQAETKNKNRKNLAG